MASRIFRRLAALLIAPGLLAGWHSAAAGCPADVRGADAVKRAVIGLDARAFSNLIDIPALAGRVARGLPDDDPVVAVLPDALERSRGAMAQNLIVSLRGTGGSVVDQTGTGRRLILRSQGAQLGNGLDYVEFALGRDGCVVDWRSLTLASDTSHQIRHNLLLGRDDENVLSKLFGVELRDPRHGRQLRALGDAMRRGDREAAVKALDGMEALARESFELTMMRVGLLSHDHESDAYRDALADLAERFGDDERTQFMLVDHYYFVGDYDRGLRAVERMQKRVGRDEENELLRGGLLKLMGRQDEAVAAMRSMVSLAPQRPATHGVLVAYLSELGRVDEALAAMRAAADHDVTFDEETMQREPAYAALLASDGYATYRAERDAE